MKDLKGGEQELSPNIVAAMATNKILCTSKHSEVCYDALTIVMETDPLLSRAFQVRVVPGRGQQTGGVYRC